MTEVMRQHDAPFDDEKRKLAVTGDKTVFHIDRTWRLIVINILRINAVNNESADVNHRACPCSPKLIIDLPAPRSGNCEYFTVFRKPDVHLA